MACVNPFTKYFNHGYGYYNYYSFPCGYCLNCRKDKQQYIIDRAEYEYKKRLTASFVTLTYDDIWNIDHCAVLNPNGGFEYDTAKDGTLHPRFTLVYEDLIKFIDSIRHYIKEHTELHSVMCQPDFSYLYCGEYGDLFGRNHFHVLFFGLDFAFCKKIIFERWKYGFIDCLPLLDGGIAYVTKYMDKQVFGALASEQYDNKGLARPKLRMSVGFGKGLLLDNAKKIKEHNMTYPAKRGAWRPISAYWKKLLCGNVLELDTSKNLDSLNLKIARNNLLYKTYNLKNVDKEKAIAFKKRLLLKRERDLEIRLRNSGHSVIEFENVRFNKYFSPSWRRSITQIPIDIQRILVDDYRESLSHDYIPF